MKNREQYKALLYSFRDQIQFLIMSFYSTLLVNNFNFYILVTMLSTNTFMIFFFFLIFFINIQLVSLENQILGQLRNAYFYVLSLFVLFLCNLLDFLILNQLLFNQKSILQTSSLKFKVSLTNRFSSKSLQMNIHISKLIFWGNTIKQQLLHKKQFTYQN
ncbi:unnamed protein product [Paramecium sonneborni]|uniref:Transmembrane protein n=1 Tax=Paramecium sonneborni TaxID=65129 RepID=A0A8S1RI32_9CILI|nr:unnamed protein product [Paramecium sonneborni]